MMGLFKKYKFITSGRAQEILCAAGVDGFTIMALQTATNVLDNAHPIQRTCDLIYDLRVPKSLVIMPQKKLSELSELSMAFRAAVTDLNAKQGPGRPKLYKETCAYLTDTINHFDRPENQARLQTLIGPNV